MASYNPGVTDRSGELLARGMEGMGASVGRALEVMGERKRKEEEEQKRRARMYDALVNYADASGAIPKNVAKTMSLEEVDGRMRGLLLKSELEKQQKAAAMEELRARALQMGLRNDRQQQRGNRQFNERLALELGHGQQLSPEGLARLQAETGADPKLADGYARLREMGQGPKRMPPPELLNIGGVPLVFNPGTGAQAFLPEAPAPKAAPGLTPGARVTNRTQILKQISGLEKEFETASPLRQRMIRNEIANWNKELTAMDAGTETAPAAAPKAEEKVKVISPSGKAGMIPKSQLQQALSQGYQQAP